ncbi:MAG: M10 family metallopeptidase [Pseudomonadota bacterium]
MGSAVGGFINGRPTNGANPYIDSLNGGSAWRNESGASGTVYISYALQQGYDPNGALGGNAPSYTWSDNPAWSTAIKAALSTYEAVCDVKFVQTAPENADVWYWLANSTQVGGSNILGWHDFPAYDSESLNSELLYGVFNRDYSATVSPGSLMFSTLVHELGHGMGLAHPHDGGYDLPKNQKFPGVYNEWSTGTYGMNQGIWTIMSYNDGWNGSPSSSNTYGCAMTPMALDIAALQGMYGANMTTALGNTTYVLPTAAGANVGWACIWDCGGTDTISNLGSAVAATINLNAAPLTGPNAGGYVSWDKSVPGGFTIANGVTIENAIGGSGADFITGNAAKNTLTGGDGADTLVGGADADTLYGGEGNDVFVISSLADFTTGEVVRGEGGADELRFAATTSGTITLSNMVTIESVVIGTGTGATAVATGTANLSVNAAAYTGNGLTMVGNAGANTLTGTALADNISGGSGYDVLIGGTGADTLIGGAGNDSLTGGGDADVFVFNFVSGTDHVTDFVHRIDHIQLSTAVMGLGSAGTLSADAFYAGSAAHDATDRIIYKQSTGVLFYDSDGTGSKAAVQIGVFDSRPVLTLEDFWVI